VIGVKRRRNVFRVFRNHPSRPLFAAGFYRSASAQRIVDPT